MERKNVMQQEIMTLPMESKTMTSIDEKRHSNFIESNTQAITLEDLTEKNIIPTFSDNSLTISHQNFRLLAVFHQPNTRKHLNCWKARRQYSTNAWPLSVTY